MKVTIIKAQFTWTHAWGGHVLEAPGSCGTACTVTGLVVGSQQNNSSRKETLRHFHLYGVLADQRNLGSATRAGNTQGDEPVDAVPQRGVKRGPGRTAASGYGPATG